MEIEQAGNAARAAKAAGLSHVVWTTADDSRPYFERAGRPVPWVMGGYTSPHRDAKSSADGFFIQHGVPTTFVQLPFFHESLLLGMGPVRDKHGELILTMPIADREITVIGSGDIGRTALRILQAGGDWIGDTVSIATEHVTGEGLATMLTKAVGEKVTYQPYTWDEFRGLGFPHAVVIANGLQYLAERSAEDEARDIERTHSLNPHLESYSSWIEANKETLRNLNA